MVEDGVGRARESGDPMRERHQHPCQDRCPGVSWWMPPRGHSDHRHHHQQPDGQGQPPFGQIGQSCLTQQQPDRGTQQAPSPPMGVESGELHDQVPDADHGSSEDQRKRDERRVDSQQDGCGDQGYAYARRGLDHRPDNDGHHYEEDLDRGHRLDPSRAGQPLSQSANLSDQPFCTRSRRSHPCAPRSSTKHPATS